MSTTVVNSRFSFHPFVPRSSGFDVRSMRRGKHLGAYPVEEQRPAGLSPQESLYDSRKLGRRPVEGVLLANHAPPGECWAAARSLL